jgi:hypothetical protein
MHTANQPWNVLDGADKQSNPRSADDLARLNRYAPVLRSYCAAGDPVCAGGNVVADHLNYFELYTDDASSWVVSKINGAASLCPVSAPSSSVPVSSPTAPASSSVVPVPSSSGFVTVPSSSGSATVPSATPTAPATPIEYPTAPVASPSSTSPVTPSPFPSPVAYDSCVVVYEVKYVYV